MTDGKINFAAAVDSGNVDTYGTYLVQYVQVLVGGLDAKH